MMKASPHLKLPSEGFRPGNCHLLLTCISAGQGKEFADGAVKMTV